MSIDKGDKRMDISFKAQQSCRRLDDFFGSDEETCE